MFPNKKITGIFQPHLYSRTRDFAKEFGTALSNLDSLILLPIYPARELPIENVSEGMIFDNVRINEKKICSKEEALNYVKRNKIEVLLTLGAGDIDALVEPIRKLLTQ
jgi:UDP-N-acetylmuramate--alanine ligase